MPPGIDWPLPPNVLGMADQVSALVVFLAAWIAESALTGWLAGRKGRDSGAWVLIGLVLGPLALLAVLLAPRVETRPCPRCARTLDEAALRCSYCGHELSGPGPA